MKGAKHITPSRPVVKEIRIRMFSHFPGSRVYAFEVQSNSNGEEYYWITRRDRKPRAIMCTCPDFLHRGFPLNRPCGHIRGLRKMMKDADLTWYQLHQALAHQRKTVEETTPPRRTS